MSLKKQLAAMGIFVFCFGYFASYVPFSMITKMITKGLFDGMNGQGFDGLHLQPVAMLANTIAMLTFITLAGWWKYATHSKIFGISIPRPQWFTFLSGLCTGGVIITTILAYTFDGVSIVFAMLLMRGGVLVMAPIVDMISFKRKRTIFWPSWVAAGLSLAALFVTISGEFSVAMKITAIVDIGLYLLSYFIRFSIMGNYAKSSDIEEKKRYFTEEQMTANVVLFGVILIIGFIGSGMAPESVPGMFWYGMSELPFTGYFWHVVLVGTFSYGTGLFGSLIFLDRREHTFTVPANRVASILSGVIATYLLAIFWGERFPSMAELIAVGLIILAIVFLAYHSTVEKQKKAHYEPEFLEHEAEEAHHHHASGSCCTKVTAEVAARSLKKPISNADAVR